jgi:competence protein ComEC
MIIEWQRRPFGRPLFWWIAGILLQTSFPDNLMVEGALLFSSSVLLSSVFIARTGKPALSYDARWVWGMLCALSILSLSAVVTTYVEKRPASVNEEPAGIMRTASRLQQRWVESIDGLQLTDTEKSVFASLTVGYTKALPREVRGRFSTAGVSHILSVSGFHVAVVCNFLSVLLGRLPRSRFIHWMKYLLNMGLLWAFVLMTGLAVASIRAGIMYSFYLTGQAIRRMTDSYNTLAAAAFCMLAYNPFYLFDVGFQLSYIAVFFILYLQPELQKWIDVRNPLLAQPWSWVTVTIAAQVGTAFLCAYYFGSFSLVFLFANLPVMLCSMILIPAGLAWLLLPAWMPGYGWLQAGTEKVTQYMVYTVDLFGSLPGASYPVNFGLPALLASYAGLLAGLFFLKKTLLRRS